MIPPSSFLALDDTDNTTVVGFYSLSPASVAYARTEEIGPSNQPIGGLCGHIYEAGSLDAVLIVSNVLSQSITEFQFRTNTRRSSIWPTFGLPSYL